MGHLPGLYPTRNIPRLPDRVPLHAPVDQNRNPTAGRRRHVACALRVDAVHEDVTSIAVVPGRARVASFQALKKLTKCVL